MTKTAAKFDIKISELTNPSRDQRYLNGIIDLHRRCQRTHSTPYLYNQDEHFYKRNLNGDCLNVIAQSGDNIVGYAAVRKMNPWPSYLTPTTAPIDSSALLLINLVDPDWRGKRIGSMLTERRLNMAREFGYQHVFSTVHPDNAACVHNLQKQRFKIIEHRNMFNQQLPRYVMYLDLSTKENPPAVSDI